MPVWHRLIAPRPQKLAVALLEGCFAVYGYTSHLTTSCWTDIWDICLKGVFIIPMLCITKLLSLFFLSALVTIIRVASARGENKQLTCDSLLLGVGWGSAHSKEEHKGSPASSEPDAVMWGARPLPTQCQWWAHSSPRPTGMKTKFGCNCTGVSHAAVRECCFWSP